ncbi:hypothetical protein [Siminovitchia fortis]|uniref:hypothetical protein n=1 Tax=Siminovitchia fortis TaxID=254758 RepID=UPI001642C255|nr:hypothetical protein [Siminovitchia fortis]
MDKHPFMTDAIIYNVQIRLSMYLYDKQEKSAKYLKPTLDNCLNIGGWRQAN